MYSVCTNKWLASNVLFKHMYGVKKAWYLLFYKPGIWLKSRKLYSRVLSILYSKRKSFVDCLYKPEQISMNLNISSTRLCSWYAVQAFIYHVETIVKGGG